MKHLIDALRSSCATKNWHAALFMTLALPDVCAKLMAPGSKDSGLKYKAWFEAYLADTYRSQYAGPSGSFMSADDLWKLRCSLLHEGSDMVDPKGVAEALTRFVFTDTGSHLGRVNDALIVRVTDFAEEMIAAVDRWQIAVENDQVVQQRVASMAEVHQVPFRVGFVTVGG